MKVCHCENPRLVFNKYLGRKVLVSCGKCPVCLSERRQRWIARICQEAKCHQFVRVLQLDYNDDMIPNYKLVNDSLVEQQPRFLHGEFDNFFIPLKSLEEHLENFEDFEKDYVYNRLYNHRLNLPHCSVLDIQNFKKRLATYIKREVTGQYGCFRSVCASEYGSTTFRPHYHMVIFFDDSRIATELPRLAFKAWSDSNLRPFGHVKVELDRGNAASYISKYICKPADIPALYSHPSFRPFFLTSKCPPIGDLLQSDEEVRQIFENGSLTRVAGASKQGVTVPISIPLGKNIENRLFPKCPLYSVLPDFVRVDLYKSVITENGLVGSFDEYLIHVFKRCYDTEFDSFKPLYGNEPRYCKLNFWQTYKYAINTWSRKNRIDSTFAQLFIRMTDDFESLSFPLSVYRCGCRVWHQSKAFGVSFDEYLNKIFKFYGDKELSRLSSFYTKEVEFVADGSDYRCMYPETFLDLPDKVSPVDCVEAQRSIIDCKIKENRVIGSKVKSAYLDSKKCEDPVLFNSIKLWYNGKKCNEVVEAIAKSWS